MFEKFEIKQIGFESSKMSFSARRWQHSECHSVKTNHLTFNNFFVVIFTYKTQIEAKFFINNCEQFEKKKLFQNGSIRKRTFR